MNIKQNLEIIKNIANIDIEFNRRLLSIGYQLFSNDREIDESVYDEEFAKFVESLQSIQKSTKEIIDSLSIKNKTGENK
jgi:hypothetical protein